MEVIQDKIQIRLMMKQLRANLSDDLYHQKSKLIFEQIDALDIFKTSKIILVYSALKDEPHTMNWISTIKNKQILLPSIIDKDIVLKTYFDSKTMRTGKYNIMEPLSAEFYNYQDIDLSIIPGQAFTSSGIRLGRGKGYYDRFLPKLEKHTTKIGVCFDYQLIDNIPNDTWDIPMDIIISA